MVLRLLGVETVGSSSDEEDDDLAAGQDQFLENVGLAEQCEQAVAIDDPAPMDSQDEAAAEEDDEAIQLQLFAALGAVEAASGQATGSDDLAVSRTASSEVDEANGPGSTALLKPTTGEAQSIGALCQQHNRTGPVAYDGYELDCSTSSPCKVDDVGEMSKYAESQGDGISSMETAQSAEEEAIFAELQEQEGLEDQQEKEEGQLQERLKQAEEKVRSLEEEKLRILEEKHRILDTVNAAPREDQEVVVVVEEEDWEELEEKEESPELEEVEPETKHAGDGADNGSFVLDTGSKFLLDTGGAAESSLSARDNVLIKVPAQAVELLVGEDGTNIARLADSSGAELSVVSGSGGTRLVSARGSSEAVSVAQRLIKNFVAELPKDTAKGKSKGARKGASGDASGICKWFAAGFCRNRAPDGCCRNGSHDGEAALRAEQHWVAESPAAGTVKPAKLPVLLLLDLEGGGNQRGKDGEDEIIEVPVLAMCPVSGCELGRFHRFSRPGFWDQSRAQMQRRFPPECFNNESSAVPFPEVMQALRSWICGIIGKPVHALRGEDFLFVTCGNWDVKTIMPKQCNKPLPGAVDLHTQRLLLWRWCNLKEAFRRHFGLTQSAAPTGMRGMLKRLGIPLAGQHHLGMDDVSNLATILRTLVVRGARLEATGYAEGAHGSAEAKPRAGAAILLDNNTTSPATSLDSLFEPAAPSGLKRRFEAVSPADQTSLTASVEVEAAEDVSDLPVSAEEPGQGRSASGILAKYSALRRADDAGHDVRIKRREVTGAPSLALAVDADGPTFSQRPERGKGASKGKSSIGFGGKCRRLRR